MKVNSRVCYTRQNQFFSKYTNLFLDNFVIHNRKTPVIITDKKNPIQIRRYLQYRSDENQCFKRSMAVPTD